jgi:lipopolysaccharide transport system ATP-binding protein
MNEDIAISVENVSKAYRIWDTPGSRLTAPILEETARLFPSESAPGNWLTARARRHYRDFWALKDISFDLRKGESLGIIGRNGSGKSTLLQIIAGTLQPTTGNVQVNGRVAALLELGSGFNPEFTGRENVYLNGAVLGFSRTEMDARFEGIAAFADIGDFIDQPVKTYSSGMMMRLAFAVQTAVEPELLIVDEALAVGDMFFQAKCMARLRKMLSNGLSLLMVSHDPGTIKSLCSEGLLLEQGGMLCLDKADIVSERYFAMKVNASQGNISAPAAPAIAGKGDPSANQWDDFVANRVEFEKYAAFERSGDEKVRFVKVALMDASGQEVSRMDFGQPCRLTMALSVAQPVPSLTWSIHIRDSLQRDVLYADATRHGVDLSNLQSGDKILLECDFALHLKEGFYSVWVACSVPVDLSIGQVEYCDLVPIACQFYSERPQPFPIYAPVLLQARVHGRRF